MGKARKRSQRKIDISDVLDAENAKRQEEMLTKKLARNTRVEKKRSKSHEGFRNQWRKKTLRVEEMIGLERKAQTEKVKFEKQNPIPAPKIQEKDIERKATYDVWNEIPVGVAKPIPDDDGWLSSLQPVSVKNKLNYKTNKIRAIETPRSGFSYHPDMKDLKEELQREGGAALRLRQSAERLSTLNTRKLGRSALPDTHDFREVKTTVEEPKKKATLQPRKILTRLEASKRRRRRRTKLRNLRKESMKKKRDQMRNDLMNINDIHHDIVNTNAKLAERQEKKKDKLRKAKEQQTQQIGRGTFHEDVSVLLPHELPEALVGLSRVGNPLKSRYENLQKRNIIECTAPSHRRRGVSKYTVGREHRMFIDELEKKYTM